MSHWYFKPISLGGFLKCSNRYLKQPLWRGWNLASLLVGGWGKEWKGREVMCKVEKWARTNLAHLLSVRYQSEAPAGKARSYKAKSSVILLLVLDWTLQYLNWKSLEVQSELRTVFYQRVSRKFMDLQTFSFRNKESSSHWINIKGDSVRTK